MSTQKDLKTLNWSVHLFKDLSEQINSCPLPPGFTPNLFYMDLPKRFKQLLQTYQKNFTLKLYLVGDINSPIPQIQNKLVN